MIDIARYWEKTVMIQLEGGEDNYNWHNSVAYKDLEAKAQALSPGKRIWDGRTRAYRYLEWHEPRLRNRWLRAHGESSS